MAKKSFEIHTGTPDFNLEYSNISLSRSGNNLIAKITDAQLHLDSGYYWFYYRVAIRLTLYSDAAKTNEITSEERTFITKPKPIDFYKDPNGFAVSGNNEKCWFDAKGNYAKTGYFPKNSVDGEVSIDVSTYTGTIYADVLVYGESDSGDTTDMNGDGVADQDCPCTTHGEAKKNGTFTLWTDVTAGSISIDDNGNNTFTIDATSGSAGIGNDVHLNRIFYKIVPSGTDANTIAYTYNDDYNFESGNKSMSNISITEDCTVYAYVRTYGTQYGTPANPGGDARNRADSTTDSQVVKYYVAPKWGSTTNLTFASGDRGQYNNRPRLKKPLKWTWTGAEAGNTAAHNVLRGYQIYICNGGGGTDKAVNLHGKKDKFTLNSGNTSPGAKVFETSTNNSTGAYDYVINRGTTNHALVTDGSGNISFTPTDLGFASKNICYCRVRPFSYWGNRVATEELDSDGNKATYDQYAKNYGPWLIGICTADGSDTTATYIKGTQCILSNGAVVWVRVDTNGDGTPDTWKEGIVYVYDGTTWKEAEGVYVCTDVNEDTGKATWKEST